MKLPNNNKCTNAQMHKCTFIIIILMFFFTAVAGLKAQIPNPSFENPRTGYPNSVTSAVVGAGNQFAISIGECDNVNSFPPINCNGWYLPTYGTSDYFNTNAYLYPAVWIPNNTFGNQYPSQGQGYTGLLIIERRWSNYNITQYREYMQAHLTSPLLKGYKYSITMKVSRADIVKSSGDYNNILHSSRKIGIHFSPDRITRFDDQPINRNPQIILNDQPNNVLSNTGGPNNDIWMTVANLEYIPDNDMNYITIGNFDADLNSTNTYPAPYYPAPANSAVIMYYYVDDLQITQLQQEGCECNMHTQNVEVTPSALQLFPETQCCYDFNIDFIDINSACPIYGIRIFDEDDPSVDLFYQLNTARYQLGSTFIVSNICVQKSTTNDIKQFRIEFLDSNGDYLCHQDKFISCNCDCNETSFPGLPFDFIKIVRTEDNDYDASCCWNIIVKNPISCHFKVKKIQIEINNQDHFSSYTFFSDSWSGTSVLPNKYEWVNNGGYILPNSDFILGKICTDLQVNSEITIRVFF